MVTHFAELCATPSQFRRGRFRILVVVVVVVAVTLALCEQSRLDFLLFQLANSNVYVLQKCSRYFEHLYAASPKGRFPQYTARSSSKTTANKR